MQWTGTWHAKTWSRGSFATLRATNASCIGVNPILALQLWKNFLIRNSTNMKMMRNVFCILLWTRWFLQHDSLCFRSDDSNHYTSFSYQVQTMLVYYLKANRYSQVLKVFMAMAMSFLNLMSQKTYLGEFSRPEVVSNRSHQRKSSI